MSVQPLAWPDLLPPGAGRRDRTVLAAVRRVEFEACAGVLIVHVTGEVECSEDPACPADLALHDGTVGCADVLDDCCG